MEIVVTDERDERFIKFCDSFGCFLDEPHVVLLLMNFGKTVGCTSFKVYDEDSAEISKRQEAGPDPFHGNHRLLRHLRVDLRDIILHVQL